MQNPNPSPVDWGAYVDAQATVIGLSLTPEQRAGVIVNLERIAQIAAVADGVPLTDTDESAAVFRP